MAKPITIKITGDVSGLGKAVGEADTMLGKLGTAAGKLATGVGLALAGIGAAAGVAAVKSIGAASDLNEALAKNTAVWASNADAMLRWADNSATAFGMSQRQALDTAATYGNLLQSFGVGEDAAAGMSQAMVQLAADFASFNNVSMDEALGAIRSGLSGETEPLKRFGVVLSDVRLKEEALALGLIKSTKDALTPAAKAQAAYSLMLKDSALAQGDFARTSDGMANKQRILKAQFEDVMATIGQKLLPVATAALGFVSEKLIPLAEKYGPVVAEVIGNVAGKLAEFGQKYLPPTIAALQDFGRGLADLWQKYGPPVIEFVQRVITAVGNFIRHFTETKDKVGSNAREVVGIFQRVKVAVSSALKAVVAVVQRAAAIIAWVWENYGERIVSIVAQTWTVITGVISTAVDIITGIFDLIAAIMTGKWGEAWEAVKRIVSAAWDGVIAFFQDALALVGKVMSGIGDLIGRAFKNAMGKAGEFVSDLWGKLVGGVSGIVSGVGTEIAKMPQKLLDIATSLFNAAKNLGGQIVSGLSSGLSKAVDVAADIASAVKNAVVGAINWVIDKLNDGIPDSLGWGPLAIDIPDNPIPRIGRATGGPASGLTRVNERGPEDIILPRGSYVVPAHRSGGGQTIVVNVAPTNASPYRIAREVAWAAKTSGR